ncbi:MAG: hypothetical protein WC467_04475 [Patescibacteria group bacterium]
MSSKFAANFGETNYPGKIQELKAEKEEKKKEFVRNEQPFDDNAINAAERLNPIDPENRYNSAAAEEQIIESAKKFKTAEDVVDEDQDENSIINAVDEKISLEKASLAISDPYDYADVIEKLFLSAQAKGDKKEMDDILDRTSLFIKQYQKLLGRKLDSEEEKDRVEAMFKEIVGEVAYIKEGDAQRTELLSDFREPRNARPGQDKGSKIYYAANDKVGRGFLTQAEADRDAAARAEKNKNKGNINNKKTSVISGLAQELKAFNPFTGKKESINNRRVN